MVVDVKTNIRVIVIIVTVISCIIAFISREYFVIINDLYIISAYIIYK